MECSEDGHYERDSFPLGDALELAIPVDLVGESSLHAGAYVLWIFSDYGDVDVLYLMGAQQCI